MKGGDHINRKKGVDVLEFVEYDEQGRSKGADVLEFVKYDEQGCPKGLDILEFATDDEDGASYDESVPEFVEPEKEDQTEGIAFRDSAESETEDRSDAIEVLEFSKALLKEERENIISKDTTKQVFQKGDLRTTLVQQDQIPQTHHPGTSDAVPWTPPILYPATNFAVAILCKKIFVDRKGREVRERGIIEFRVIVYGRPHDLSVKYTKIRSIAKIITDSIPESIVDYEVQKAEKIVEERFRQDIAYCKSVRIYFEAGWNYIDGRKIYLYDGLDLGADKYAVTGLTLPRYECMRSEYIGIFLRACDLYRDMTTQSALLMFSLMGILYQPFREAGFVPRFVLFLNGQTGSMKTTIGKILFTQLCEEAFRDDPRRFDTDTAVSLERAIVTFGRDTITLVDDFAPAKTEAKRREMQDKLEIIIRMVGDGSSRSRSNVQLEDKRGEGVRGMVALTGEHMGKGISSNLRCLYCRLERDLVNEDTVTWFQENSYAYTTFLAAFAVYVGQRYNEIKTYIQRQFNVERKFLIGVLKERRLVDSAVTLQLASDILHNFLLEFCGMDNGEVETMILQMRGQIVTCARISEELSKDESVGTIFVKAIAALMRVGNIKLIEDRMMLSDVAGSDGFMDEQFFYFNPDLVHKKVVAFLGQTNIYFPYDLKEVQSLLGDERISQTAPNGNGKRTLCARISVGNGKKYNFLKIRRTIFEAVVEGTFESERGR